MKKIENYVEVLCNYFKNEKLVLIIGSGFTANEPAHYGNVYSGTEFQNFMRGEIIRVEPSIDESRLPTDFSGIADIYLKVLSEKQPSSISIVLKNRFTNVDIKTTSKLAFISSGWPYIYTLNIDDGLEKQLTKYTVVLPNKKLRKENLSIIQGIYKLHGDANAAVVYDDDKSIIFSKGQYIKSLNSNTELLNLLKTDYVQKNILFIGCSLKDEIDFRYIFEIIKSENIITNDIIYLTSQEPDILRKIELENIGVNHFIVEDYDRFYTSLSQELKGITVDKDEELNKYKNIKIKFLNESLTSNIQKFIDPIGDNSIQKNEITIPYFTIDRIFENKFDALLNAKNIIVLLGKRFSGKSLFILNYLSKIANKEYYYFPSYIDLNDSSIDLLLTKRNTIIVFDSNSISNEQLEYIYNFLDQISRNNSKVIFIVNASDRITASIITTFYTDDRIEVSNYFAKNELAKINEKLSRCGILNFNSEYTILENSHVILYKYKLLQHLFSEEIVSKISRDEIIILISLLTWGKIYYSDLLLYDIKFSVAENIVKKFTPLIEIEEASLIEDSSHSTCRLSSSSTIGLCKIIALYTDNVPKADITIANIVYYMTTRLLSLNSKRYTKLIMFDNLNQITALVNNGTRSIITNLYDSLSSELYNDSHYWLQRAKALYHMERNSIKDMKAAENHAIKAVNDASKNSSLEKAAKVTLALIKTRISVLENFSIFANNKDALLTVQEALNTIQYNKDIVVQGIIDDAKKKKDKNDIYRLVKHFMLNPSIDSKILQAQSELMTLIMRH